MFIRSDMIFLRYMKINIYSLKSVRECVKVGDGDKQIIPLQSTTAP